MDLLSPLPVELLQNLPRYLPGPQLARLSFVSSRLYTAVNVDKFWLRKMNKERLHSSPIVQSFVDKLCQDSNSDNRLGQVAKTKLLYLVLRKLRKNWARSNYKEGMIQHFTEQVRIGFSTEYLVALETGRVRTWDLTGQWVRLLTNSYMDINLANPVQNVYQILLHGAIAIICFSFGDGPDSSDFQLLRAYDLENEFRFLWEKAGLIGLEYHVVRLLGSHLYILDLVQDTVTVYPVTREEPAPLTVLGQPRNSVRLPHGDMAADDTYLAVPGKDVQDNSPVVVSWHLATQERKVLRCVRPVCPFRWFQKSSVKEDIIYGLLNRFRLVGWSASAGHVLFSLDLTNYSPGDAEESYSWLETGPGLVVTVHRERLYATVLSSHGQVVGDIRPILPDWCYRDDCVTMIEEVNVCGHMAVLRMICYNQDVGQLTCLILPVDLTQFHQVMEERASGQVEHLAQLANVATTHVEELESLHCTALVTPTKLLDVQPLGIKFYDFLTTDERCPGRTPCQHHDFVTVD